VPQISVTSPLPNYIVCAASFETLCSSLAGSLAVQHYRYRRSDCASREAVALIDWRDVMNASCYCSACLELLLHIKVKIAQRERDRERENNTVR